VLVRGPCHPADALFIEVGERGGYLSFDDAAADAERPVPECPDACSDVTGSPPIERA
jgi:hypothetical protein